MTSSTRAKRSFGEASKLPSGRYRARYTGPDGQRHTAPYTFDTKGDADMWLSLRRVEIVKSEWAPPAPPAVADGPAFKPYALTWITTRRKRNGSPLARGTQANYRQALALHLAYFADTPLEQITPAMVKTWWTEVLGDEPTMRAHTYSFFKGVLATALDDELIQSNPCRIRGASRIPPAEHVVEKVDPADLAVMMAVIPEQYRLLVLIGGWCGLRSGELRALRRGHVDGATLHVRKAVTYVNGEGYVDGPPKTAAGIRDVAVPPHLLPMLADHLARLTGPTAGALLFPPKSTQCLFLSKKSEWNMFDKARRSIGRPDLHMHDLRHTAASLAGETGATVPEMMARMGHATATMVMHYQHATKKRDAAIAAAMSESYAPAAKKKTRTRRTPATPVAQTLTLVQ